MRKYIIADLLSASRFVWAVVLVGLILIQAPPAMWVVLATTAALLTDALDGAAAKKWPYPDDGKYRWWRQDQKDPDGSSKTVSCLDTPADLALGLSIIAYTYFMVSWVWGLVLFLAVPSAIIGLIVINRAERSGKTYVGLLRNIRLAIYLACLAIAICVWLFTISHNPVLWLVIYLAGAVVIIYLKRGRLIHGKSYNNTNKHPKPKSPR
ncbi:hypothetical protein FWF93_00160 [Candidatus Saccharibacteria bacterium]|nr:hypothetical protein [Candidatus Saccharibacteria bacterium]